MKVGFFKLGSNLSDCRVCRPVGAKLKAKPKATRQMLFRNSRLCGTTSNTVDVVRSAIPLGVSNLKI